MATEEQLKGKQLGRFTKYIELRGAVVGKSNNPYEIIRFTTYDDLNIIYKNKHGYLTFSGDQAETAFNMWLNNKNWHPVNRKRQQLTARKNKLAQRDGFKCFWCDEPYEKLSMLTVEHVLSFRHQGTDNINNLTLACKDCQKLLGSKSIADKIKIRDENLRKKEEDA